MIPQEVKRLFDFIDFLDENKDEYKKYIPLCDELIVLSTERNSLNPNGNYKDKVRYDVIQKQITEKFQPITENVYSPIANKLIELGIWSGDNACASIWNNNYSAISEFKENFTEEEARVALEYKQKYIDFRKDTNTNFLSLQSIFNGLDQILKELFDFFKDTNRNEFEDFEAKQIKVGNLKEALEISMKNGGANILFSINPETPIVASKEKLVIKEDKTIINNRFHMGDNINIGDISNKNGNVTVGKNIGNNVNGNDHLAKKSFAWQKWGIIFGLLIAFITLIVTLIS